MVLVVELRKVPYQTSINALLRKEFQNYVYLDSIYSCFISAYINHLSCYTLFFYFSSVVSNFALFMDI